MGAIAVVISLIFVAQSINRNTAQLPASHDNFLIQLTDEHARDLALNPDLVSIYQKVSQNEALTEAERFRYAMDMARMINRWELAFVRHKQGYLDLESWQVWDTSVSKQFLSRFPQSWWPEWRDDFTPSFVAHVDALYERASNQ